jgi:hypothetical protein
MAEHTPWHYVRDVLALRCQQPPRCCVAGLLALREARCGCFGRGYDSAAPRVRYELWDCGFGLRVLLLMGMEFIGWREGCLLGSSG